MDHLDEADRKSEWEKMAGVAMQLHKEGVDAAEFHCCICGRGLEVRQTKKGKPYVICDPCVMQMVVRVTSGIQRFEGLVKDAARKDLWERLDELQERYKKKCPKCGKRFWVSEELMETSMFDGSFVGYRCPEKGCKGVVKAGESR